MGIMVEPAFLTVFKEGSKLMTLSVGPYTETLTSKNAVISWYLSLSGQFMATH